MAVGVGVAVVDALEVTLGVVVAVVEGVASAARLEVGVGVAACKM